MALGLAEVYGFRVSGLGFESHWCTVKLKMKVKVKILSGKRLCPPEVFTRILYVKGYALLRFLQRLCMQKAMPPLGFHKDSVCQRLCPPHVFTKTLYVKGYAPLRFLQGPCM